MKAIEDAISKATGQTFVIRDTSHAAGGCINETFRVSDGARRYFVKANQRKFLKAFENEAAALHEIADTNTIRVPEPIACFAHETRAYLILEHLDIRHDRGPNWHALGQGLAAMHRVKASSFGWTRDNQIGSTPQPNPSSDSWVAFFAEHRLAHQIKLCHSKGFTLKHADRLVAHCDFFFENHRPRPSLLHGDLWSGNVAFLADGTPFLFDPASYYGDRETDLAFTEFFGGFHRHFYEAYQDAYPLSPGYAYRKTLYNLYHCLNHVYLFGAGYATQAQKMADQLLSEL